MTKKSSVPKRPLKYEKLPRTKRITILLNEKEMAAVDLYIRKYAIKSKANLAREALMRSVITRLEEDAPRLF